VLRHSFGIRHSAFVISLLLFATATHAQTNDLTALLQQGLLEEQANRDYAAAIADYQSLAARFDQDRQIAATAIFRLGECYRAQGRTNEAAAQYQRILHDFADQPTLATLSRQDLAGMMQGLKQQAEVSSQPDSASHSPTVSSDEDREIQRVQEMIQNSPDLINAPGGGTTPLVNAAYHGWVKVTEYLLAHGADINVPCPRLPGKVEDLENLAENSAMTPLMAAVTAGNKAMTQFLLDHGANIHFKGTQGNTALHLAASHGFFAVAEVLLANHADVNAPNDQGETPLFFAAQKGQVKIIQQMLAAGANPNVDDSYRTPLSLAVDHGPEAVKILLAAKADPNGGKFDAPLLCAIHNKDTASAELLLQAGANPNAQGNADWGHYQPNHSYYGSPLFLAVSTEQLPMVQLLLKFKGDPNLVQDGRSLLFSSLGNPEILKALLDAGADANAVDSRTDNRTALLLASGNLQSAAAVELLLQHGANPDLRDDYNNTALHLAAADLVEEKVFTLLLDHKANPNLRNRDGETPLHLVSRHIRTTPGFPLPAAAEKTQAQKLIALLHKYGALDILPAWDQITLCRPANNFSTAVFHDNTNHWNHFTLLEALYTAALDSTKDQLQFPDLAHIIIVRPSTNGTPRRIAVNFLSTNAPTAASSKANGDNGTAHLGGTPVNGGRVDQPAASDLSPEEQVILTEAQRLQNLQRGIHTVIVNQPDNSAPSHPRLPPMDYSQDVPLEFGDVVEVPEREHSLADAPVFLTGDQDRAILEHFRSLAGEARLVVQGGQTVPIPLQAFYSHIGNMLQQGVARAALTSNSDLSRVRVTRHDPKTNNTETWTVDCSNPNNNMQVSALRLRAGDLVEVPAKP